MAYKKVERKNYKGETYRADEHSPNLADLLRLLDVTTLEDILMWDLCENGDPGSDKLSQRGPAALLPYQRGAVLQILKEEVFRLWQNNLDAQWIFDMVLPLLESGRYPVRPPDIERLTIPEFLDQLGPVTLGKVMGELQHHNVEWFNDNINPYMSEVMEAGGRAIEALKRHLNKPNITPQIIFMDLFDRYDGGKAETPWRRSYEEVTGKDEECLQPIDPIWTEIDGTTASSFFDLL